MAGQERIDSIIDIPAVRSEYDELMKMLEGLGVAIKKSGNGEALKNPSISMKELRVAATEAFKSVDEMTAALKRVHNQHDKVMQVQKKAIAELTALDKAKLKLVESETKEAKEIAFVNAQRLENNRLLKIQAQLENAVSGSIEEARIKVRDLNQQRNILNITTEAGKKKQAELNAEINRYNDFIKANVDKLSQQKINIGNYTGALGTLEKGLADVNKKLDEYTKAGKANTDEFREFQKEQELLSKVIDDQSKGFATMGMEMRALERVLLDMKTAGLEDTESFKKLFDEVAKGKDEIKSFKKEMATRGSGELFLEGAIQSAQALASMYGLAKSAATLFGTENEALEKTMVKLQAVFTILTSLEALNNALKKENALVTSLLVIKTTLLTAAKRAYAFATGAATLATKAFKAALVSTGFGAIIVAIGMAVQAMIEFAGKTKTATDNLYDLGRALASIDEQYDVSFKRIERNSKLEEAQAKARGASELELIAIRNKGIESMKKDVEERKGILQRMYNEEGKSADELRQLNAKIVSDEERVKDLELELEENKLSAKLAANKKYQESRKQEQETALAIELLRLNEQAEIQQSILDDEKKGYEERLAALTNFNTLRQQIIDLEAKRDSVGVTSSSQLSLIEEKRAVAENRAFREGKKKLESLEKEYEERRANAQFNIQQRIIERHKISNQEIAENENLSLEERLDGLTNSMEAELALIEGSKQKQLQDATLLKEERLDIEKEAAEQRLNVESSFLKRVKELTMESMDDDSRQRVLANEKERDEALKSLNEQFAAGKISLAEYNRDRLQLTKDYTVKALQIEIDNVKKIIAARKAAGINVHEQEAQLAALEMSLSDQITAKKIDNMEKVKEKAKELSAAMVDLISNLVTAGYDRELNAIQDQVDANNRLREAEIERINSSTMSEQDKAARLAQIRAQQDVENERMERKRREVQLKQARFDRTRSIFEIAANTAIAISKAVAMFPITGGMPFAAIAAAIGAVQIAAVLARPLPRFATGTESSPEGPAIVGEKGTEMMITPDGRISYTPDRETVTWLERGTRIIPNDVLTQVGERSMWNMIAAATSTSQSSRTEQLELELKEMRRESRENIRWLAQEMAKVQRKMKAPTVLINNSSEFDHFINENVFYR